MCVVYLDGNVQYDRSVCHREKNCARPVDRRPLFKRFRPAGRRCHRPRVGGFFFFLSSKTTNRYCAAFVSLFTVLLQRVYNVILYIHTVFQFVRDTVRRAIFFFSPQQTDVKFFFFIYIYLYVRAFIIIYDALYNITTYVLFIYFSIRRKQ